LKLLAIDTAANLCSVCVFDGSKQEILAQQSHDIGRGHAELLMEMIDSCLQESRITYANLERLAVTIGPGSFTGLRVGISVARGLALSLDLPVAGISTLDACEAAAKKLDVDTDCISLLDARRGELYCKFQEKMPFVGSYEQISQAIKVSDQSERPVLCGSGALVFNEALATDYPVMHAQPAPQIALVAELASDMEPSDIPPEPLYLRPPDAKIQTGFALEHA